MEASKDTWKEAFQKKQIHPKELKNAVAEQRKKGSTIATLNGSFDLLHAGHLHILYEAKKQADVLIVALNSDESIRQYKGSFRPLISLADRMQMLAALYFVDHVTWFNETDPRQILEVIQPDVHVNGMEYGENCIEALTVRKYGGKLFLVPRIAGLATTQIIEKIQKAPGAA